MRCGSDPECGFGCFVDILLGCRWKQILGWMERWLVHGSTDRFAWSQHRHVSQRWLPGWIQPGWQPTWWFLSRRQLPGWEQWRSSGIRASDVHRQDQRTSSNQRACSIGAMARGRTMHRPAGNLRRAKAPRPCGVQRTQVPVVQRVCTERVPGGRSERHSVVSPGHVEREGPGGLPRVRHMYESRWVCPVRRSWVEHWGCLWPLCGDEFEEIHDGRLRVQLAGWLGGDQLQVVLFTNQCDTKHCSTCT